MDRFAQFVGLLADSPDEPAPDLAAVMYLSRSHLDRLVRAAAGETPAAFRRRLLLERAAYRLRTSDTTILDAAVEAGYSSHEAFTRAFQRAYGDSPSAWRGAPSGVLLDAPNGVHFHPPGGLRLPARDGMRPMRFVTGMVEHHLAVLDKMLAAAESLPDETLDAPIELSVEGIDAGPTIRRLLSRLVGQLDRWNAAMRSDAYAERPYVFTAAGMIAHVLTYAAHRRTLVTGALASAGADLEDDPLTWFTLA